MHDRASGVRVVKVYGVFRFGFLRVFVPFGTASMGAIGNGIILGVWAMGTFFALIFVAMHIVGCAHQFDPFGVEGHPALKHDYDRARQAYAACMRAAGDDCTACRDLSDDLTIKRQLWRASTVHHDVGE